MNSDGLELIKRTIADLEVQIGRQNVIRPTPLNPLNVKPSPFMQSLMGVPQETPDEIAKLQSALSYLSPDTLRGHGSFFDSNGQPEAEYWLAGVWGMASLGWTCGKDIAKVWSQQSARYTDQGFENAWKSYNPQHPRHVGIGSLYKRAMQLGWQANPVTSPNTPSTQKYKLLTGADLNALPPVQWRLKGIFPYEGLCSIYGQSGSGKSFLVLDLAAAIADGNKWFGIRTTQSPIVYVALEGESGFKYRVAAWEKENSRALPANMHMVMQPFEFTNIYNVIDLSNAVPTGSVIIVDTLNRASPTSDENSSKEMGEILKACKELQNLTSGLVVVVHHTGKDATRGARGHSSFFAALDGAIEVQRTVIQRSWSVAKAKDGQDSQIFAFDLKVHTLGVDTDGDDITSCTVGPALTGIFVKPQPQGKSQQAALKTIKAQINTGIGVLKGVAGSTSNVDCIKVDDAVIHLAGTLTTAKNKRMNQARTLVTNLKNSGFLGSGIDAAQDAWCWIT